MIPSYRMALASVKMCLSRISIMRIESLHRCVVVVHHSPNRLHSESTLFAWNHSNVVLFEFQLLLVNAIEQIVNCFLFAFVFSFIYSGGPISCGSQRTFWGIGNHAAVAVVGLGDAKKDWDDLEKIDGVKENIRIAVAGE